MDATYDKAGAGLSRATTRTDRWRSYCCCCLPSRCVFFVLIFFVVLLTGFWSVFDGQRFLMTPTQLNGQNLDSAQAIMHTTEPSGVGIPRSGFIVDTPGCQIQDFDPFDKTVLHTINKSQSLICEGPPPITYVDGEWLRINTTVVENFYDADMNHCKYQEILRPMWYEDIPDKRFSYNKTWVKFTTDIKMTTPFFRLTCHNKKGSQIYKNFHALILTKPKLEQEADKKFQTFKTQSYPKETLNVIALGMDSMSRLNFIRQMPKVRRYIVQELQAAELKGYNKISDSTLVNIVPTVTGKFVAELPYDRKHHPKSFDNFTFIWNNFSSHGYRTLYAEDAPWMATFNMGKGGFHKPPADYYLRPFNLALEASAMWHTNRTCVGTKLEAEIVLDYLKDFITRFEKKPYFAFTFLSKLTHNDFNRGGLAEDVYLEFFKWMKRSGNLNNTVVIFFSDHGIRYGPIRETYMGKLEERLPLSYVIVPPWFSNKYPALWKNLRTNQYRLATNFDYYATMKDLLVFDGKDKKGSVNDRGISLFSSLPIERTCEHASIISHFCTCHQRQPMSLNDTTVRSAADAAIGYIHSQLDPKVAPCAVLKLQNITGAMRLLANDNVLNNERKWIGFETVKYTHRPEALNVDYLINFQTTPGNGKFEATVRHITIDNRFEVIGEVSRINRYEHAADCMPIHSLEKYCYCV